jgi:phage tail P2-like protein
MAKGLGAQLIYQQASGLEQAMADVDAERLIAIYAELIIDQWDPVTISATNLPYLAWAMGVNLWEGDYWTDGVKRDWVQKQWLFQSLRGTPKAFEMALGQSGYVVTDMLRPPQGFYAAPDFDKATEDAWIRQMPQIRVYWAKREGTWYADEFFCDGPDPVGGDEPQTGFSDADFVPYDDGWALLGREAILRQNGVDTKLNVVEYTPSGMTTPHTDYDRISTVGLSTIGSFFVDEDFADDRYLCFEEKSPQLITVALDREYFHDTSTLGLTVVKSSLAPITPRYERDSDIGDALCWTFSDDMFVADTGTTKGTFTDLADGGEHLLADFIYLLDPDVAEPSTPGISFSDHSRVGIPSFYGELQIDLRTHESKDSIFVEDYYAEESYAAPEDDSHRERAFRAVLAAKALRDTVPVSFEPVRPLEMGDYIKDTSAYGDWIAQAL